MNSNKRLLILILVILLFAMLSANHYRYDVLANKTTEYSVFKWLKDRWTGYYWLEKYTTNGFEKTPLIPGENLLYSLGDKAISSTNKDGGINCEELHKRASEQTIGNNKISTNEELTKIIKITNYFTITWRIIVSIISLLSVYLIFSIVKQNSKNET